ncbi:MAG TPA: GNAT family acetyltransferase [Longimicrobium sp.]|nr:GNAT family acetyltransferase [Longimicrobium sp.]
MSAAAVLRGFRDADHDAVLRLWRDVGLTIKPSDSLLELRKLVARNPGLFLVAEVDAELVGTVIGAWDGRRGWIYHLAVSPAHRRRGIGSKLMMEVERRLREAGATKINLLIEPGNATIAAWYRALGYAADELIFMAKRLT